MDYCHNKKLVPFARHLRKEMTKEERRLWFGFLSGYRIRFIRQKVIGQYIVDFYCAKANLVIEIDGSQHYEESTMRNDAKRTEFFNSLGLTVLRIANNEITQNFNGVCEFINKTVEKYTNK